MLQELDHHTIKRSTVISTLSLFFQSGYSALLGLAANLVLTILLSPTIFGIYITVLSFISLLNYFSDIGLAASLIQKKELQDDDINTTFTVQQTLIISLITVGYCVTPFVKDFYKLPIEGVYLYWSLLFSFFISSLKTIPSIFLERKIQFQKIVLVQIIENTVFYIAVIIFAIMGLGLRSFTIAVLLRAVIGLIVIYTISRWKPKLGFSPTVFKELISFGLPFQASSFLALFKDDLIILYLSKVLGFEAVGYIGWAKKWAEAPIRIIMDNVTRVLFPVIARYQDDKGKIAKLIHKVFYYQTAVLAPTMITAVLLMSNVVDIIPKYHKWAVALPMFYLFCLSSFFVSYSSPLINLFNALGKVRISFIFMLFWTIITWSLTPLLTQYYGYYGFPIAHVIVSSTSLIVVLIAKRTIEFSFFNSIYKFILSACVLGIVIYSLNTSLPFNKITITIIATSLGWIVYGLVLASVFKINIHEELQFFLKKNTDQ